MKLAKDRYDVGRNLMDLSIDNPPDGIEDHNWRDEVFTMVAGATDTVVSALAFLFITLANHSAVQEKVQAEIQEVMQGEDRDVTLQDLNAMTYLGQAILETIRIHGTFPVILRRATRDTKLSNSVLPAGSRILLPLLAMGWNEDNFPQPEKFLPERFSPESVRERHSCAFLPFSAGPRNCLGKVYGMHLMKIVAVHVLRRYNIKSQVKLEDIEYELKVVMFSKTPLNLQLESRTNQNDHS